MCPGQVHRSLPPAFSPPPRHYNYAPCFIQAGRRLHVWYCANVRAGVVADAICHRSAIASPRGWKWGPEDVALVPSPVKEAWDSRHVCDPEVVSGRFRFEGKEWHYLLLYLGTDAEASTHNQVGAALSNALNGPWRRYPRPIVGYTSAAAGGIVGMSGGWPVYRFWGVGQPSAIPLNKPGTLLIFYSRGEEASGEEMVEADLSDLDRGPLLTRRAPIPMSGLRDGHGPSAGVVNNVGVALSADGYLYMVCDGPLHADDLQPDFISSEVELYCIEFADLRRGCGRWQKLTSLDAAHTGWPRNHNACILKGLDGRIARGTRVSVGLSVACAYRVLPDAFGWLWTYRVALIGVQNRKAAECKRRGCSI